MCTCQKWKAKTVESGCGGRTREGMICYNHVNYMNAVTLNAACICYSKWIKTNFWKQGIVPCCPHIRDMMLLPFASLGLIQGCTFYITIPGANGAAHMEHIPWLEPSPLSGSDLTSKESVLWFVNPFLVTLLSSLTEHTSSLNDR